MASGSLPTPRMDWSSPDRSQALNEFRQVANMWFTIKRIASADQHTYIILWSGKEGLRMFNTWNLTEDELNSPVNIWDAFSQQLVPRDNFRIHRLEFQRFKQGVSESIDDFVLRCRTKAAQCNFTTEDIIEERIIEVLIAGVSHPEVQKTLLSKDAKLTLKGAITEARAHEASIVHMSQLQGLDSASVHAMRMEKPCGNCGGHHQPRKCPAFNAVCHKCQMTGHWGKCCRSSASTHPTYRGKGGRGRERYQGGRGQFSYHGDRGRGQFSYHGDRDRGQVSYRGYGGRDQNPNPLSSQKNVHPIDCQQQDSLTTDMEAMSLDAIFIGDVRTDGTPQADQRDEIFANLSITLRNKPGNHTLKVKVDTGAQGNVLPLRTFRRAFPELLDTKGYPRDGTVQQEPTKLYAYNGAAMHQYGCVKVRCQYKDGKWLSTRFYVVDTPGPVILGLQSAVKMRLVEINCEIRKDTTGPIGHTPTLEIRSKSDLQNQYPDQFRGIGQFPGEYDIALELDVVPVVHPARKFPIHLKEELREELDRMESMEVIEKVSKPTDWVSSLAISRKSNGKLRVCLDPKDLNKACKRTYHKAPTLEETTHKLHGARVFSKLDARHGYWSIQLTDRASDLTTFNSPFGRYRFRRLPFGLKVAQDIFQEKMDLILSSCPGTLNIADDIIVYGHDGEEHDKNLHVLMTTATKFGLVFNLDKCDIKVDEVAFFGCIYGKEGVRPDPKKVEDIHSLPPPSCVRDLQRFLGMIQYMSPFIPNLATHTDALRSLTKKDNEWQWTASHQQSFDVVKSLITSMCTLTYFDPTKQSTVQVDASSRGLGAVLLQDDRPVAFASKALTETEQRYANIEREMLAVVFGCTRFHTYLYGSTFIVESDHKPLESIHKKNLANAPPRLQRMLLRLQPYDFQLVYKPGSQIGLADGLSRINPQKQPTIELNSTIHTINVAPNRLVELQRRTDESKELKALKELTVNGWPDEASLVPKELRKHWSAKDSFSVEDGVLLKGCRIIIPEGMQQEVLKKLHEGHQGVTKTQLRAKSCVYWDGISKDIEHMVGSCTSCREHQRAQQREPLLQHDLPSRPWETVGTDLFHLYGDEYLIITDYHSKFPFIRKVRGRCTSGSVVQITKDIFSEQGIPLKVISDNGPQFASQEYKAFAQEWGFQHVTSSPHYPQSNGLAERAIQTVKRTLTKVKESNGDLHLALLSLRTTPVDTDLPSPAELLQGRKMRNTLPDKLSSLSAAQTDTYEKLIARQNKQKENYDCRGVKELPPLRTGEKVLTYEHNTGVWSPATVVEACREQRSYLIQTPNGGIRRRNRRDVRTLGCPPQHVNSEGDHRLPKAPPLPPDRAQDRQKTRGDACYTRSGRRIVKPNRLIEQ
ncbi:PREDICTED: uncharacterized protein K02A2.6-like isoform X3 [Priapulus caudatus]|uniref:RNA-directed DNA polymerase n=1 Tax=Priapulus caudatus TaxID=37621 RepID=A0ABM1EFU9_PRICU|nr:PREDICTED: uncharacterized protein K02A2.6-like isoform X2 [Priapulus caudatus]XP_014671071.1 PREDICTED: uncharacterized protein K02A2.6-like isoform X3 [Priapulus caudatus]